MKVSFLIVLGVLLVVFSFVSTNFNALNPHNGVWSAAGQNNLSNATIQMSGLNSPVNVTIDQSGVAHIKATDFHDLMFAQGYYSASQRLFQMELEGLLASGNLSKYIGSSGLSSDQAMRLIGMPANAYNLEQAYKIQEPIYYKLLEDYAQGVNAYINSSAASNMLGFKLLGIQPYQWSVFYTLCWQQYMAWSLTTGAAEPLQSALLYNALGFQNTSLLWPYYPYFTQNITEVPGNGTVNGYNLAQQNVNSTYLWSRNWYDQWATGVNTTLLKQLSPLLEGALKNISDPYGMPGAHELGSPVGSNSWVVTANYSSSGFPIMANDPHLPLTAPSIWIPMQLEAPGINVTGWDLAGVPGILIGHTSKTAWGLTTSEGSSANDFLETLNGTSYLYGGSWHQMQVSNYTLLGKNYSIYSTNNGPLIAREGNYGISLNWTSRQPSFDLIAELQLDQSTNYTQMVNALKNWGSPPQNFAMASDTTAGYITAGWYPIINETLPNNQTVSVIGSRSLLNGSLPQYEPYSKVPFQYLPQAENPQRGYMFSPNQPTAGKEYPYPFIGGYWASGGRAQTISHYLGSHPNMTISNMMQLQSNVSDYWASMLAPQFIKAIQGTSLNSTETVAFHELQNWNYTTYENETGITVYWYLASEVYNMTFQKVYSEKNLTDVSLPFITSEIYIAQNYPNSSWVDGNFTTMVRTAFSKEVAFLMDHLGNNASSWTWSRVHFLDIASPTGLQVLSIHSFPIWGGSHTVSVGSVPLTLKVPLPYVSVGSSLRTVASPGMGEFYGVIPGGPSGNILGHYFADQLSHWVNHEYYNMNDQSTVVVIRYE